MTVNNLYTLQKRIDRFFDSHKYRREEVRMLIEELNKLGRVAVFGGMLRDLAFAGNNFFSSDVDLVVDFSDTGQLTKVISNYKFKVNSFGGCRVFLKKWTVDIWELKNTWAFKNGHVEPANFQKLISTTFFNWDAIVYMYKERNIFCKENYLRDMNEKLLDINLEENPNNLGATVRAIRFIYYYEARVSPRLSRFIYENLEKYGIKDIYLYQIKNKNNKIVSEKDLNYIKDEICCYCNSNCTNPFSLPDRQFRLF